ncbi:ATP-dependent DNA helicase Pif1-like [Brevipalpus obovatus]|uniref:ATP-dependent DNA helicase Pif1-like n=1 Tax=Brevipalpus obovatus TaxID=246614 RepID=UPI003D9E2C24
MGNDNQYLQFFPQRNDTYMARYNKFVTQVWRANTDFSPIVSGYAVLNYIAKYASKGEHASAFYSDNIRNMLDVARDETPARSIIRRFLCSSIGERDYSAQEVMHIVMGWPLSRCSRAFVNLVIREEQWDRLEDVVNAQDRPQSRNLLQKYCERPNTMSSMTLFYFAKFVYTDHSGQFKHRANAAIVRVFPQTKLTGEEESDEKYYMQQCVLNCAFRSQPLSLLLRIYEKDSWQALYRHLNIQHREELDFPSDDDPFIQLPHGDDEVVEPYMAAAAAGPIINRAEIQNIQTSNPSTINTRRRSNLRVKRIAVQGRAGSGKSTLIQEIVSRVSHQFGPRSIVVCAPTGVAANNINGSTIHSLLRISISNLLPPLNGERLMEFQQKFRELKFLIIDEMSMIGAKLLGKIDKRCREMHPANDDEFFGGLHVYLFGDYRQLPPVKDAAVYRSNPRRNQDIQDGLVASSSIQQFIELRTCHRQREATLEFRQLLDNLSNGNFTRENYDLLMTRRVSMLSQYERERFTDAIQLFCQNKQVLESNRSYLSSLEHPVARIQSENRPDVATAESEDILLGLPYVLNIAIGCRVMLRTNVWVEGGLVNGSLGTVRKIVFEEGTQPPALPLYIGIQFDDYSGPHCDSNCFPITPVVKSFNRRGSTYTRRQFPLALAYSITIHKSQGLTLNKIAVDIGENEVALGLTYVALTRSIVLELLIITFKITVRITVKITVRITVKITVRMSAREISRKKFKRY